MLHAATPSPYPTPSGVAVTASQGGSPGFLGFVFTFLLAIAVVLLFLSLTKQLRRVDRRAKQQGLLDDPDANLVGIDAGAAGPDLEVDADGPVAQPGGAPGDEPDAPPSR
ncbi:hypothetical protein [Cellulomonas sp. PhB150]|uniref:hypothetical protein n=1 Tax=Cellulomonas sp. PhB150 TaxID=2485188 RepID=UPI000F4702ED|nr:hypothetical protein [Cellulomonas sp. PhB150]ROS23029.1 hypothetical protein EDF34_3205 [Cellulomonas sp. PhB150]